MWEVVVGNRWASLHPIRGSFSKYETFKVPLEVLCICSRIMCIFVGLEKNPTERWFFSALCVAKCVQLSYNRSPDTLWQPYNLTMGHHLFSSSTCLYSYSTVVCDTMISCGGASGVYKCVRTCSCGSQSTIFDDISQVFPTSFTDTIFYWPGTY